MNMNGTIEAIGRMINDLEQEQEDKEAMNTTISNLNNQINQLNQNIQIREGQLQQALNEMITLGSTVNLLNGEIVNLHSQIIILNHELQSLEEENQQLQEQIFTLQNNILDFEISILDLQTSLDDANNTSLVLIEILNSTNDELTSVNTLLTSIKIELGVSNDDEIIPMIQLLTSGNLSTAGNSSLITGGDEKDMIDDGMEELILIDEDISTK